MKTSFLQRVRAYGRHPLLVIMAFLWSTSVWLMTEESVTDWAVRLFALPWIWVQLPGAAWVRGLIFPAACGLQMLRFMPLSTIETMGNLFLYASYLGILLQPPAHTVTVPTTVTPTKESVLPYTPLIVWGFVSWIFVLAILGVFSPEPAVGLLFSGVFGLAHFRYWLLLVKIRKRPITILLIGTSLYALVWWASLQKWIFVPGLWIGLSVWVLGVGKITESELTFKNFPS